MHASTKATTEVLDTPAPAPVRHYWELFATDGPADLYRGFALDAVDDFLKPLGNIEEEQTRPVVGCGESCRVRGFASRPCA